MELFTLKLKNFYKQYKEYLPVTLYYLLVIALFLSFFNSITNSKNTFVIPKKSLAYDYANSCCTDVSNFDNTLTEDLSRYYSFINNYFSNRNKSLLSGDVSTLSKFYDLKDNASEYFLSYEIKRAGYLFDYAKERNMNYVDIFSETVINNFEKDSDTVTLSVEEHYYTTYNYKDNEDLSTFSTTLNHDITLKQVDDSFVIYGDYYKDMLNYGLNKYNYPSDTQNITSKSDEFYIFNFLPKELGSQIYNREASVFYAKKYSGSNKLNGSLEVTNSNYYNSFNSSSNACNFISQCLTDKDGGNLPQDSNWYYKVSDNGHTGSNTWINSKALVNHLISTNTGTKAFSGNYKDFLHALNSPSKDFQDINIGDLILYEISPSNYYISIITDFDSKGYPLISSHSINRYNVPFDLGYTNDKIIYTLIHITK